MIEAGIILEGGAQRGVFTAGVLDYLMEKELYFPHVIGVSAGCCSGIAYISKQIGRTRNCMIHKDKKEGYINLDTVVKKKTVFDMDKLFDTYPNKTYPFDYETYNESQVDVEWVVTNCLTGKAEYMDEREDRKKLMDICKASSSIPGFSPMVYVDQVPYLDGGISDSIPINRMRKKGVDKIVIVSTRNRGYRKKQHGAAISSFYDYKLKDYPLMAKAIQNRYAMYNRTMREIESLEKEGKVFVVYPEMPVIKRAETDHTALMDFYVHGKECMREQMNAMITYLSK